MDWSNVVSGAVGGVIGVAGALLGKRWDDRRLVGQQRAERLRDIYARLAQGANTIRSVLHEQSFVIEGETLEDRDKRHQSVLRIVDTAIGEIGGHILIEPGFGPVRASYIQLRNDLDRYLRSQRSLPPGGDRLDQLKQQETALLDSVATFLSDAETAIAAADELRIPRRHRRLHW